MKEKIVLTVFSPLLLLGENVFASVFEERTLNADDRTQVEQRKQERKRVEGVIVDEAGKPIVGATIIEQGTTNGTNSDVEGKFVLDVAPRALLLVNYLGYAQVEYPVRRQSSHIQITMYEDSEQLDEVVVIGYGTTNRRDLTGAVGSVTNRQFSAQPIKKTSEILQGRIAGVQASSYSGAQLGADANIRVRGVSSINFGNDPLWVVDGVIGGSVTNPADIASIEVLKDASSTAIYGSRGANGVILVTTKRGAAGKPHIQVSSEIGVSNMPKRFDMMNAYEYAQALEAMTDTRFSPEDMEAFRSGTKGVDYQDLMLQTGVSQDYKLNISGGNQKNRYFVSGLFLNQTGITTESELKRYGFRANLDSDVTNWLSITTNVEASTESTHNTGADLFVMANYSPAMDLMDENGVYLRDPYCSIAANPYG